MKIIVYAIAAALLPVRLPRAPPTLRLLTLAFALCVGGGGQAQTETVTIPDANLRGVLEAELNKQAGAPITRAEMRSLQILGATSSNIADLTGLEHATGLIFASSSPSPNR